jgi:hypothetical protein
MTHIERDSVEWLAAWRALAAKALRVLGSADPEALGPDGSTWQYMGSSYAGDGRWMHHFRHRQHPATERREYLDVPATAGFQPEVG